MNGVSLLANAGCGKTAASKANFTSKRRVNIIWVPWVQIFLFSHNLGKLLFNLSSVRFTNMCSSPAVEHSGN